jgi:integrase
MYSPGTEATFAQAMGKAWTWTNQRVIRPAVQASDSPWYGRHGFRRGIASNLVELGANDKIVQRVLRHAKPHVTRERYIKTFDPALMEAMQRMQVAVNSLQAWPADELTGM